SHTRSLRRRQNLGNRHERSNRGIVTPLTVIALGAIAGLTIFLGLPIARLQSPPRRLQAFLNAGATGVLVFLFYDIIAKASEPINKAIEAVTVDHASPSPLIVSLVMLAAGMAVGLLGLVVFERMVIKRPREG